MLRKKHPNASSPWLVEISRPQVSRSLILLFFWLLRPPSLHLPLSVQAPKALQVSGHHWMGNPVFCSLHYSHAWECGELDSRRNEKKIIFNFKENPRYLSAVNI